ncbi:MAG: PAS domain S-box protein [Methanoregula sp.]|nr:PAS domain S-box protein [Methanoregula sp.]
MISVLYVDDDPALLEIGTFFLENSGQFRVDTVTSAQEALQKIKSMPYDAIVSDYQMPDMDGIAFLKEIRREFPDLPFIIFTGKGREEVVIEAFDNGADFYLQKGGNPTPQFLELGHKIIAAVRTRQAEKALQDSETRYRNVVEDQTEFISRFLPNVTHVFVNEAYCRYFKKSRDEIIGNKFKPDIPQEDKKLVGEYFLSLTKENPIGSIDHRIIMPDGEIRWQRWSDRAIFNDGGSLIEYQSVGRDITETKQSEEELRKINEELKAAYEQIAATEEELRQNYDELNKKEQKLRESEEKYRRIVETAYEGIWVLDSQFRIIQVNNRMAEILGYQPHEIRGQLITDFIHADDFPDHEFHASVRRKGIRDRYERRYLRKDGTWLWTLVSATPVFKNDEFVGSFAMVTDISERKSAEEALQKSEQLYRTIVETAPGMLIICDSRGRKLYVSSNCRNITGYTQGEIMDKRVWWVHEDDTPRMKSLLKDALENKISRHNVEFKGIEKDGKVWYGSLSWEPIMDGQGNMIQVLIQVIDITDRKNVEETLKQSEHRFSDIINNLPDATLVIDPNGKVIAWNKAIEDLTGVKAEDMIGKGNYEYAIPFYNKRRPILIDLIFHSDEEIAQNYSEIIRKNRDVLIAETTLPQPKGKRSILWAKASPLYDDQGTVVGAIESIRDITERKKTSDTLKDSQVCLKNR